MGCKWVIRQRFTFLYTSVRFHARGKENTEGASGHILEG